MWSLNLLATAGTAVALAMSSAAATQNNKQAAVAAMTDIFSKQDASAVDRYFSSPYRQHNTRIPDGLDALKGLAQVAAKWPGVHTTIYRALADGDFVVLHSEYENLLDKHESAIAFDLFRFNQAGKIVEHWDALEPLKEAAAPARSQIDGDTEIVDLNDTDANRTVVQSYIDRVKIAAHTSESVHFFAAKHFVEHGSATPRTFAPTEEDLAGRMDLQMSDLHYMARRKTVAEGNFVLVQSEGRLGSDTIVEIFDLFRLRDGKIVEHWDVHQPVPPAAKWRNTNGPF